MDHYEEASGESGREGHVVKGGRSQSYREKILGRGKCLVHKKKDARMGENMKV